MGSLNGRRILGTEAELALRLGRSVALLRELGRDVAVMEGSNGQLPPLLGTWLATLAIVDGAEGDGELT